TGRRDHLRHRIVVPRHNDAVSKMTRYDMGRGLSSPYGGRMSMVARRRPRLRELYGFLPAWRGLPTRRRKLAEAADIGDLRALAMKRAPRLVFDYVDGAAEDERSLRASVEAFDRLTFHPRVLRDVGVVNTTTRILGR